MSTILLTFSTIGAQMTIFDELRHTYAGMRPYGSVTDWFQDCTEVSSMSLLRVGTAYMHFAFWCKQRGFEPIGVRKFAREAYDLGVKGARNSDGRCFIGLRIKPQERTPPPAAAPAPPMAPQQPQDDYL